MRRRSYRNQFPPRIDTMAVTQLEHCGEARWETAPYRGASIEKDLVTGFGVRECGASDHISWRQLGCWMRADEKAQAALVDELGPLSTKRFGDQRHRIGANVERGGMKLHEFEIRKDCARPCGHRETVAHRADRVGGVTKQACGSAGRDHGAAGDVEHFGTIAASHEDAADATLRDQEVLRDRVLLEPHVFRPIDRGARARTISAPVPSPFACRMRLRLCAASRPSAKRPSVSQSKRVPNDASRLMWHAAEPARISTRSGSHRPAPASSVSRACKSGPSSGATAAAIPPCASGLDPLLPSRPFVSSVTW
jgi:hypothetical protein